MGSHPKHICCGLATHLTITLLKDVVEVCGTIISEDETCIVDDKSSLSKLSVVDGAKTKAIKAGTLQAMVQTLMSQPSLQDFGRTAAIVSAVHISQASCRYYGFRLQQNG